MHSSVSTSSGQRLIKDQQECMHGQLCEDMAKQLKGNRSLKEHMNNAVAKIT
jgi:hypothetical protein